MCVRRCNRRQTPRLPRHCGVESRKFLRFEAVVVRASRRAGPVWEPPSGGLEVSGVLGDWCLV